MDAFGTRPALFNMAERLATNGYNVLLPDLYYRFGLIKPFEVASAFKEGSERDRLMQLLGSLNNQLVMEDTKSFLDFLDQQPCAAGEKRGCIGYCMGGAFALFAAERF
jgi:carboxymethylenebutenolidase